MNKRMAEIFNESRFTAPRIILFLAIAAVIVLAGYFLRTSSSNLIQGAAVGLNETVEETEPVAEEPQEELSYTCKAKLRRAEGDVKDIETYMGEAEEEYRSLKKRLITAEREYNEAQAELDEAKERLYQVKQECS